MGKTKQQSQGSQRHNAGGRRQPRLVVDDREPLSDSEDEEIPEDEAFNSDDERKYGAFFRDREDGGSEDHQQGDDDGSDGSDSDGSDEDDEEGDGGRYMLDLLDNLDSKKPGDKKADGPKAATVSSNVNESEFSASVVPKAGLTLDSLMKGLEDTKGFGAVQRTMKKVAQGTATSAPLDRVVSDRTRRKLHYEDQSKEVSQWITAVQQNRQAETLDFRPKERMEVTREGLVESFVPTTEFEKQIHAALEEAGQQDEEAMLKAEEDALKDDLGANEITLEEYKKRRGQLAKMRSLLFSYEQKRHHMKKIKSKKYRRIRKRQRERQKDAELEADLHDDPEIVMQELREKEELERMKERMTLAHKNTSKWAKRVLKRGKNVDVDTRRALSAQLKRGDDLLQRMKSTTRGDEDDSEQEGDDLLETARRVLQDDEATADDSADAPIKGMGLFKLSFMQKGIEKQKEMAREEARQLLRELNDEGDGSSDDGDDGDNEGPNRAPSKPKMASREEMKDVLGKDDMVVSQLKLGGSHAVAVSGDIIVESLLRKGNLSVSSNSGDPKSGSVSIHASATSVIDASGGQPKGALEKPLAAVSREMLNKRDAAALTPAPGERDDSNPWLAGQQEQLQKPKSGAGNKRVSAKQAYMVDVERAIDLLEPDSGNRRDEDDGEASGNEDAAAGSSSDKITTLTQEELVRRAFASSIEKEADDDFAREKEAVEGLEEDPNRGGKRRKRDSNAAMTTVAGWGSWAGEGAPPPGPSARKLPKKLLPPKQKLAKRKRADEKKPNVIISEKRVKKTADKFMLSQVPYPYSSREEYERVMSGGVGREWNVTGSFKDMTRPEVITRAGKVIQPLSKKVKQKRPAAKF